MLLSPSRSLWYPLLLYRETRPGSSPCGIWPHPSGNIHLPLMGGERKRTSSVPGCVGKILFEDENSPEVAQVIEAPGAPVRPQDSSLFFTSSKRFVGSAFLWESHKTPRRTRWNLSRSKCNSPPSDEHTTPQKSRPASSPPVTPVYASSSTR